MASRIVSNSVGRVAWIEAAASSSGPGPISGLICRFFGPDPATKKARSRSCEPLIRSAGSSYRSTPLAAASAAAKSQPIKSTVQTNLITMRSAMIGALQVIRALSFVLVHAPRKLSARHGRTLDNRRNPDRHVVPGKVARQCRIAPRALRHR